MGSLHSQFFLDSPSLCLTLTCHAFSVKKKHQRVDGLSLHLIDILSFVYRTLLKLIFIYLQLD